MSEIDRARKGKQRRRRALGALGSGRVGLPEVLRDGHKSLETCPIYLVLQAAPAMGIAKTRTTLERASLWPLTPLGQLSPKQRQDIIDNLPRSVRGRTPV